MQIQDFSIWKLLLGGVLIGLASAALMYFNGKIAGISGIFRRVDTDSPISKLLRASAP